MSKDLSTGNRWRVSFFYGWDFDLLADMKTRAVTAGSSYVREEGGEEGKMDVLTCEIFNLYPQNINSCSKFVSFFFSVSQSQLNPWTAAQTSSKKIQTNYRFNLIIIQLFWRGNEIYWFNSIDFFTMVWIASWMAFLNTVFIHPTV
jgi:hypothetical protein